MTNISGMAVISLCLRSVMNMVWLNDNLQLVGIHNVLLKFYSI